MAKWDFNWPSHGTLPDQRVLPQEVFYEYEEPLIFRSKVGMADCIFNKISSRGGRSYFLCCETSDQVTEALNEGRISVRGAFTSEKYYILALDSRHAIDSFWKLDATHVPSRFLPESGEPIAHWMPKAPDTLVQANSMFSVKFKGAALTNESIPLGKLKKLVDRSFLAVRALLTPPALQDTKSATLDFDCQVAFSSFVVAVRDPIVNMNSIRRKFKNAEMSQEAIQETIRHQVFQLSEKISALAEIVRNEQKVAKYTEDNLHLISALNDILPEEDSFLESVEFSSVQGTSVHRTIFSRKEANLIQDAFRKIEDSPVWDRGRIVGGSERANTVRIMSLRGKQVTCSFSSEQFDLVAPEGKIDLTRYIKVYGVLNRRRRVDQMDVQRFEFSSLDTLLV